ncbi:MAG: GNAT family N-acetyltransferase, partial [Gemmatimonadaceae bacterium]|nr:GNAT family N-acetyltransferase [Gemmatimonadaceae bacterium]
MIVRTLTSDDVATMRRALVLFGEAFEDRATYTGRPPSDDYLRQLLERPTFIAVVACDGDRVVGAIGAYVLPKFEQARSEIYLYDLAVDAAYRRRGIATAMIRELQRVGESRGAWVVFVQADP